MNEFSAPLAGLHAGRLVLASEVEWMRLSADPQLPSLFRARIPGSIPGFRVQENIITFDPGPAPLHRAAQANQRLVEIHLNGAIPWEIEFRKGVSHLDADLRQLELHSLDVLGSASYSRLALPPPSSSLYLYIFGATRQSIFLTHPDCEINVHLGQGATDLAIDHQRYEVLEGAVKLSSAGFNGARDRYELCLAGAVERLAIQSGTWHA